ncbi:ABC transporter permease [Frigidibacter mobilis]|uniref:Binding-protein-dependent transport systems inner membrane component n=1 Tax=Frigidibacter mobilis TaxID=1335048 RepID=A0A159Z3E2_9RHOB|nr:ABC transporter permease [Frigidibacter mobilis]AMY69585.1 binding-protein-dependent transport systems inner membrane component [Frigidibacter mobilis]
MRARTVLAPLALGAAGIVLWQALVLATGLPPFLLPGPRAVAEALLTHHEVLARAAQRTLAEIVAGFTLGALAGGLLALLMAASPRVAAALRPALLVSQMIPIFALAPILTLWLGYGMAPKIVVSALICFFPVASAFFDGLERTSPAHLDLARTMGARGWRALWHLRIPMALPMLGSGLKLAAVYAPVGAVIGEWVGGSEGLGAVMIHANGRMWIDLSFAALALVTLIALAFHAAVGWGVRRWLARFA